MVYRHQPVMCSPDEVGGCFNKMSTDGWEYLASHVVLQPQAPQVQMIQGKLMQGPPQMTALVFSIWRRPDVAAVPAAGEKADILGPEFSAN